MGAQEDAVESALYHYHCAWTQNCVNKFSVFRIYTPTLIVWGTSNFLFPKSLALEMKKYIVNAKIKYVQGGGHWLHEEFPGKVNRLIEEFLEDEDSNLYMEDQFLPNQIHNMGDGDIHASLPGIMPLEPMAGTSQTDIAQSRGDDLLNELGSTQDVSSSMSRKNGGGMGSSRGGKMWGIKSSQVLMDLLDDSISLSEGDEDTLQKINDLQSDSGVLLDDNNFSS